MTSHPIKPPPQEGFYAKRERDLMNTLRSRVTGLDANADFQSLVLEPYRAGWGLTETWRAIEMLKAERK